MLHWIDDAAPLPPTRLALGPDSDAPGLLAAGGKLTPQRLDEAYRQGVFPWFSAGQPVLWWSPDPRMVLPVARVPGCRRSLRKTLRRFLRSPGCEMRFDSDFEQVIQACAQHAARRPGRHLDRAARWSAPTPNGIATGRVHSVETWVDGRLVGGLYCVAIGRMVFGESMFAPGTDASKIALAALVAACRAHGVALIDCQQNTGHLASLGAHEISRLHASRTTSRRTLGEPGHCRLDL